MEISDRTGLVGGLPTGRTGSRRGAMTAAIVAITAMAPVAMADAAAANSPTSPPVVAPEAGQLVERPCDMPDTFGTRECYWLVVPERRDATDSRNIWLWVAVVHPTGSDPALPPYVDIPGGPGAAKSTVWVAGDPEPSHVTDRTIVVMDQRGTGRSLPRLGCHEFDELPPPTEQWRTRVDALRLLAAACRQRLVSEGVDLNGYDLSENAADFVDLRRALGADQFVLHGSSYSARVVREIYRLDPDGVAGLILESPYTTAPQGPASIVARGHEAIERLDAACAAQPHCAALGDLTDLLAQAGAALEAQPYLAPSAPPEDAVDEGVLYAGAITALYDTALIPLLPDAAVAIADGDYTVLAAFATLLNRETPDIRDELAAGLLEVMTCADEGDAFTNADRAALADAGPWSDLLYGWPLDCEVWDVDPLPGGQPSPVSGDVPVFAPVGQLDPVTPPRFTDEIVAQFPNTTVVVVPGGGHGVAFGTPCLEGITLAFVANPAAPLDTSCVDDLPEPFADM